MAKQVAGHTARPFALGGRSVSKMEGGLRSEVERLARRLAAEGRMTTPVLRRILFVVDEEIAGIVRQEIAVPSALRNMREAVARACILRLEAEHSDEQQPPRTDKHDGDPA